MSRLLNPLAFLILVITIFSGLKAQESEIYKMESSILILDNKIILKMYGTLDKLKIQNKLKGHLIIEHEELLSKLDTMRTNYQ